MRTIFVLLALALLPVLCQADPMNVTDYQINVIGTWIETNPSCVSNCTENMSLSYEFESNRDFNNANSPYYGVYGWIVGSTFTVNSSGFLGSFTGGGPGLETVDGLGMSEGYDGIYNSNGDEIDLANPSPGLNNPYPARLLIEECPPSSNDCINAYPGIHPEFIPANTTTAVVIPVPAGDSAWQLLLASMFICSAGLWVKHGLGLNSTETVHDGRARRVCAETETGNKSR